APRGRCRPTCPTTPRACPARAARRPAAADPGEPRPGAAYDAGRRDGGHDPPGGEWWMAYVFDPDVVHECALACLDKPKPAMFEAFAAAMEGRYPDRLDL